MYTYIHTYIYIYTYIHTHIIVESEDHRCEMVPRNAVSDCVRSAGSPLDFFFGGVKTCYFQGDCNYPLWKIHVIIRGDVIFRGIVIPHVMRSQNILENLITITVGL